MARPSEILASKKQPNDLPTIADLRAPQAKGATGRGTSEQTLNEKFGTFNQGTGIPVADGE